MKSWEIQYQIHWYLTRKQLFNTKFEIWLIFPTWSLNICYISKSHLYLILRCSIRIEMLLVQLLLSHYVCPCFVRNIVSMNLFMYKTCTTQILIVYAFCYFPWPTIHLATRVIHFQTENSFTTIVFCIKMTENR